MTPNNYSYQRSIYQQTKSNRFIVNNMNKAQQNKLKSKPNSKSKSKSSPNKISSEFKNTQKTELKSKQVFIIGSWHFWYYRLCTNNRMLTAISIYMVSDIWYGDCVGSSWFRIVWFSIDAICCGRRLLDLFQAYSFIDLLLTRVEVKRTAK